MARHQIVLPHPAECAAYIADMAAELSSMAASARLTDLAATLEAAAGEARRAASPVGPAPSAGGARRRTPARAGRGARNPMPTG